jgi:RNA polymerase sigma factor (sigma-70 family)
MAANRISGVIQHLRGAVLLRDGAGLTDGELLEHFISRRDEVALAALARRHGPMVWGVCHRILRNYDDAEDAFQVTFLVLVRKAACVLPRGMVANWLYGVAHQTALKARATLAKRAGRERQVATMPEPGNRSQGAGVRGQGLGVSHEEWRDLQSLLDEELSRLPDKYRAVLVLCDLEGKTRKEAARQLRVPEGTVAGRLARARTMLAKRLTRRGLAMSGGVLAGILSQQAAVAGVPASVVSSTIQAASAFAAGKAAISVKVAILTEGVLKAMLLNKFKTMLSLLLILGMAAFGGWFCYHAASGHELPRTERDDQKSTYQQAVLGTKDAPNPKARGEKAPEAVLKKETAQTKEGKVLQVSYPVADLVVPLEGLDVAPGSNQKKPIKTKEDWLIKKIMRTVSPASWANSGGGGTIDYFPLGMTLVVNNTPRVQAQVKYLLETMRRVQDVQIAAETRIISLNAASLLKLQGLLPQMKKDGHAVLSEAETFAFLEKAQDDAATKVVQTPKITFFPGQRLSIAINPCKEFSGINVKFNGLVAANLQHLELEVKATVGKVIFSKAMRLEDGVTLAQFKSNGDGYLILLVTPRVILHVQEEAIAPPKSRPTEQTTPPAVPAIGAPRP